MSPHSLLRLAPWPSTRSLCVLGKSLEDTVRAFDNLSKFIDDLTEEEKRAVAEELPQ
jgi:hypothetical protein